MQIPGVWPPWNSHSPLMGDAAHRLRNTALGTFSLLTRFCHVARVDYILLPPSLDTRFFSSFLSFFHIPITTALLPSALGKHFSLSEGRLHPSGSWVFVVIMKQGRNDSQRAVELKLALIIEPHLGLLISSEHFRCLMEKKMNLSPFFFLS